MTEDYAIIAEHISKQFTYHKSRNNSIKDWVVFRNKYDRKEKRIVLNNISFKIKSGETFGIVGRNGEGKSTILKLLTKIIQPDSGRIYINEKVSSLIELGAGFHPEMTGRENIYINCSIHGLSTKETDNRINSIIEFSELGEYIDQPVKVYSSGMYMRLAFSIAINVDAKILVVDEILGVGDAYFQNKCFNRILEMKKHGTTIVIVSHSLGQIIQLCDKAIWLQDGAIQSEGSPEEVCGCYLNGMTNTENVKGDTVQTNPNEVNRRHLLSEPVQDCSAKWGEPSVTTIKTINWSIESSDLGQLDYNIEIKEKGRVLLKTITGAAIAIPRTTDQSQGNIIRQSRITLVNYNDDKCYQIYQNPIGELTSSQSLDRNYFTICIKQIGLQPITVPMRYDYSDPIDIGEQHLLSIHLEEMAFECTNENKTISSNPIFAPNIEIHLTIEYIVEPN